MGKLRKTAKGVHLTKKGVVRFGAGLSVKFDKTLTLSASARDCVEFAGSALRDWYAEAHRTGQRFDAGQLPRDSSRWVGYDTGLLSTHWRLVVDGSDRRATVRVFISPPDAQRAIRLSQLAKQGILFAGLSGKALDVYTRAVATYMADTVQVS